jgi:DNA-binding winged helix-turn-helix (wHTH) protein
LGQGAFRRWLASGYDHSAAMGIRFGEFELEPATRQLRRGKKEVRLKPKAFELLHLLLTERPRVVSKAEIHRRLWPATFVSDSALTTTVNELRAALGDDAKRPRFVRTVPSHGYAFCATAEGLTTPERKVAFRLVLEDREVTLVEGENVLGRVEGSRAWIDSRSVSRRHARIRVSHGVATLEDLGSKNGTFVRERRISGPERLADGDPIRLGRVRMTFRAWPADLSTATDES